MRLDELKRIAQLTGSACLSVSDLPKLNTLLNEEPIITTVRSERPLWDNAFVVAILIGLLGMEWILRRRYDLS